MSAARRSSRQAALQVLYALDVGHRSERVDAIDEVFEAVAAHFELPEGARAFAKELVAGVAKQRDAIDALIALHATNWRVARMAAVDRNVLRMAVYEMRHGATPCTVAIDEAVELARRFGSERSSAFVNGVLDAVARSVDPREPAYERQPAGDIERQPAGNIERQPAGNIERQPAGNIERQPAGNIDPGGES
jgi:transcription antitermination protein NusB